MLEEKERENIALKKFSLIAPVLNGQEQNQQEYFQKLSDEPIDMPHHGPRHYTVKTLQWWLYLYRRHGFNGLKPGYRSDRGKSRRISEEVAQKIREKKEQKPGLTGILLYEELVKEGVFKPEKISPATFYRYLSKNPDLAKETGKEEEKEIKRFSHHEINVLWQTDILYGPYIKVGGRKKRTYLIAFIDDASRLITNARFCLAQNFQAVKDVFKEAVLKRGIPTMVYSDNGKVYRCGQLGVICASLGCSLLHAEPFTPNSKGKVERFFRTVRLRFLSRLEPDKIKSLEDLNLRFWEWLEQDYHQKRHSSLNMSPFDYFMSQAHRVKIFSDPTLLDEYFLLRTERKINHDATFSLDNILFETEPGFSNTRLEVRYEPQWLDNPARSVFLYREGEKVGEARQADLSGNARAKRRGRGRPSHTQEEDTIPVPAEEKTEAPAVSFAALEAKDKSGGAGDD